MNTADHLNESDLVYSLRCRIEDLERALGSEWRAPAALHLTGMQNRILGLIVTKGHANIQTIYDVLYGDDPDPPDDNVVRVLVSQMRRKLRAKGITLKTEFGNGRFRAAYVLAPDGTKKLNALYAPDERKEP